MRKKAKGTVEGMWFDGNSDLDNFETSFGLLNLRGDALDHVESAARLISCSDIVFMFCDADMFRDTHYKNLMQDATNILKTDKEERIKINKLFVVFKKDAQGMIKENRALFEDISSAVFWEKVSSNYQKFLTSIIKKIQDSLKDKNMNYIKSALNSRLRE